MYQMVLKIETGYISQYLTTVHLTNVLIRTLSNNKSPGPDGIVNELLRMLPTDIHETIHMLFIIMWATASRQKLGISAKLVVLVLY